MNHAFDESATAEYTEIEIDWLEECSRCGAAAPNGTVRCPECGRRFYPWIAGPAFWPVLAALVAALAAAIAWAASLWQRNL